MKSFILLFVVNFSLLGFAQPLHSEHLIQVEENRAAGCTPPSSSTFLELNNVKALIHTGGNLWQLGSQNFCHYEVPKGSGKMALFTSALWLGGLDVNGQLKLAALRYRNGQDYWTGPLTKSGDAIVTDQTCEAYDKHFKITRDEVVLFNEWYTAGLNDLENGTSIQSDNYPDYQIPVGILNWPAHGDPSLDQDYYLAPFYDRNQNGVYDPAIGGDYPWYDINKDVDCKTDRTVTLYGDETLWWVMNDKGNIHTESGGDPIGMEIRAQAFAFSTNNQINNSTFYNYELINRSTQTLYDTYFGLMVDVALGGPNDDYVGCDVSRGLGYAYNGDSYDESDMGFAGYEENPPAVGVDFFEGPYQDNDGIDNPLIADYQLAQAENGIPYSGLGIGYGDGIVDNERFGMRRFLYYNNTGSGNISQTDPQTAPEYYKFLSGYWKDGTNMVYGGNGHPSNAGATAGVLADFMFPGDTDPIGWGTGGNPQSTWTEETAGNDPYDRRFAQCAGPFILKPGAINNITVGVVWARANSGGPFESVVELKKADDKAQALFDNCFEVLEGPHAPELSIQEMENEIIISIYNLSTSNNANEDYSEIDPEIINVDNVVDFDPQYKFQGYQVYQIQNPDVSVSELNNLSKARLVFQTDIVDGVGKLTNYEFDEEIGAQTGEVMVNGSDKGIAHSFSVKEDLFASGDKKLVNHKRYYYMAIAYAHNNFSPYELDNPGTINGQKKPYLSSRKAAIGGIKSYEAIPHLPNPENGGTIFKVNYGYEIPTTQLDGEGNGNNWVDISSESEDLIIKNNFTANPKFISGASPIKVKVIDPLNLIDANYRLYFVEDNDQKLDSASWYLVNLDDYDTVYSHKSIANTNEQLIPEWGISVTISQSYYTNNTNPNEKHKFYTTPIGASLTYTDSSNQWLSQVSDNDANFPTNWILAGGNEPDETTDGCDPQLWYSNPCYYEDLPIGSVAGNKYDNNAEYEKLLNGGVAPFKLAGYSCYSMPLGSPNHTYDIVPSSGTWNISASQREANFIQQHDIDIVLTSDESKWTKCVIFEINDNENQTINNADVMELRNQPSVNKKGEPLGDGTIGMGWFPGYAIDITSGKRLNMAFSENSWLAGENGDDMIWNPTSRMFNNLGEPLFGGMHYVYVFGATNNMPVYDSGNYIYGQLFDNPNNINYQNVFENCQWIWEPVLAQNQTLLSSDARLSMRINKPYAESELKLENNGLPLYGFTTKDIASQTNQLTEAESVLDLIRIVPNPYYAYSKYENTIIDNRIKITNLPQQCTITIFNMQGQLVKRITKDNPLTFEDWNLKNHVGIPIAGGVYIFHIDVPEVGEKILKWYGALRQVDLQNF